MNTCKIRVNFTSWKEKRLSSYRHILTVLDDAQHALRIVADNTQHFLHETLREIATRLRESHTMTTNNTVTQIVQGFPEKTAKHAVEQAQAAQQKEISPEMMAEIAQTPVTKPKNAFTPRPAFMQTETDEELANQKVFNPKPKSF